MSRGSWIDLFLFLHVMGAIAGVGPSLTYGMWVARTQRLAPEATAWVLRMVHVIDRRLATPALAAQAVTGTALIVLERWRLAHARWLDVGIGLYVVVMVAALALVGPLARRRLALAERGGRQGPPEVAAEFEAASRRLRPLLGVVSILTVAILYLMIVKPSL